MSFVAVQSPGNVQRIRGPNLAVFRTRLNGAPFDKVLPEVDAQHLVLASTARLSRALVGSEEWRGIRGVFRCWSGTMTAYIEPGQRLGKQVVYVDPQTKIRWVFPVPKAHQYKRNAILVAEHPDYILEVDKNNRVVHASAVDLVSAFPTMSDWYLTDPKHCIPTGKIATYSEQARYLWRTSRRVGPVVMGFNDGSRQGIDLDGAPSVGCGAAVESSEFPVSRLVVPTEVKLTREGDRKLIVEGTKTQLDELIRLVEAGIIKLE
ncbi:MAG: hypothetical protein Q7S22_04740 [Candidatus Micrarchaeota archaeon]|nr:hypothetical protein [Candidatus Micrarchaeota archaeon]